GQAVGRSNNIAFLWSDSNSNSLSDPGEMIDLNTLIPQDSGWKLTDAKDINNVGQIVGKGTINGQEHGFLLTPVTDLLSIDTTVSSETIKLGDTVTYTFKVTNNGSIDATNVRLTSQLPQQGAIRFESASLSPVVNNINGNGFFEFDLGSLVKGESQTVTLDVKLTDLTLVPTGIVKNEATVFASEDDPNEGNNTDLTTTTISSKTKIDFSQGAYIFSEDSPSNLTNIELNRTGDDIDKPVSVVLQLKTSNEAWEDLKDALLDIDLTTYSWLKDVLTDKLKVFERFSKVGKGLAESSLNAFSYAVDVVSYIQSKSTAEEEDFLFSPVPVTFNAGEITKQISISIKDDDEIEGNQLAILSLSSPQPDPNLTLDEDALLGVADDEESVFGIDPANFLEDLAKNMAISAALGAVAGSWAGGIGAVPGLIGGAVMGVGGNYFKY
ncbi:Calx-beta domain-containing protein, partial [Planktothrix sp.]